MGARASALGAGMLFGVGLAIAGMTKPSKVVGFLDLFGSWDPSLAFVMVGAITVHLIAHRLVRRRSSPLFDVKFHLPTRKDIDRRLVLGAAVFGVGWGLGGFCPGPGIVSAGSGSLGALVFVVGMTIGMLIESAVARSMAGRAADDVGGSTTT
ncbi:MAG: hypothetical protein BGO98_31400 [Myxococcales bacterium 68-20]|nr:MAG: hypothetical protein BGO98_31400 [Myxococcales bacterium 68-20]